MKIKDGFYLTEIGTDYVVIASSPEAKEVFGGMLRLNATGAFLWKKLVEGASVALAKGLHPVKMVFLSNIVGGWPGWWTNLSLEIRKDNATKFSEVSSEQYFH